MGGYQFSRSDKIALGVMSVFAAGLMTFWGEGLQVALGIGPYLALSIFIGLIFGPTLPALVVRRYRSGRPVRNGVLQGLVRLLGLAATLPLTLAGYLQIVDGSVNWQKVLILSAPGFIAAAILSVMPNPGMRAKSRTRSLQGSTNMASSDSRETTTVRKP